VPHVDPYRLTRMNPILSISPSSPSVSRSWRRLGGCDLAVWFPAAGRQAAAVGKRRRRRQAAAAGREQRRQRQAGSSKHRRRQAPSSGGGMQARSSSGDQRQPAAAATTGTHKDKEAPSHVLSLINKKNSCRCVCKLESFSGTCVL
jgi:hypothetical protein